MPKKKGKKVKEITVTIKIFNANSTRRQNYKLDYVRTIVVAITQNVK